MNRQNDVYSLNVLFRQIKSLRRFRLAFVFGLQIIWLINLTKIDQIKGLKRNAKAKRNLLNDLIWRKNASNVHKYFTTPVSAYTIHFMLLYMNLASNMIENMSKYEVVPEKCWTGTHRPRIKSCLYFSFSYVVLSTYLPKNAQMTVVQAVTHYIFWPQKIT